MEPIGAAKIGLVQKGTLNGLENGYQGSALHHTIWDGTGHQTMVGDARPWRDELTDAINIRTSGAGVNISNTESTMVFDHASSPSDYLYLNIQLNHDKDLTATVYPHIHWFAAEQSVVPNFVLQYRWQVLGGTKVTAWTNYQCNTMLLPPPLLGVTNHNICGSNVGIPVPAGTSISDIIQFRIIRDHNGDTVFAGVDDPYTAVVHVLAFDIHFQINSLGSTDELVK